VREEVRQFVKREKKHGDDDIKLGQQCEDDENARPGDQHHGNDSGYWAKEVLSGNTLRIRTLSRREPKVLGSTGLRETSISSVDCFGAA
jgi:hypothetical protein